MLMLYYAVCTSVYICNNGRTLRAQVIYIRAGELHQINARARRANVDDDDDDGARANTTINESRTMFFAAHATFCVCA